MKPQAIRTLPMPATPRRRLQPSQGAAIGVDRDKGIIRGMVVAQQGPFKSEGRGEFDGASLTEIVKLWPTSGLRSRFAHPNESNDGLGRFLGRVFHPRLSTTSAGTPCVRGDLHLSLASRISPEGDLRRYVLALAEEDPAALSSSLVLAREEEYRLRPNGSRLVDEKGDALPPLWRPKKLFAIDIVDEGDAVDDLLSVDPRYSFGLISKASKTLDRILAGKPNSVARATLQSWLLAYRDGHHQALPVEVRELLGMYLAGTAKEVITARAEAFLERYLSRRSPSRIRRLKLELKAKLGGRSR